MVFRITFPGFRTLPAFLALSWTLGVAAPASAATTTSATATTATATPTTATTTAADPGFSLALTPATPRKKLTEINIGDPVELQLQSRGGAVPADRITSVEFEPAPELWNLDTPFRRDMLGGPERPAGEWRAVVRPFEPGKLLIPPFRVTYLGSAGKPAEAWTTTATLNVLALRPPNAPDLTLIGLRDPAGIPRDWTWLWITLAVLVALALFGWGALRWWRWHQSRIVLPPEPDLPPGLWALRELDYRSRLPVCQNGPSKPIFSHVSEVVRLYIGRRYGIHAIDMTTYECLQALHTLHPGEQVLRWMREFLDECDMIKFTTFEPPRDRWNTIWHDARLIVKMTTPPEELGEPAPAAAPPAPRQEVGV